MADFGTIKLELDKNHDIVNWETMRDAYKDKLESGNIIYIYGSKKTGQVYIGQSKHFIARHKQHYNGSEEKFENSYFDKVIVIYSDLFNGSALDDTELQLIMYFKTDFKKTNNVAFDFSEVINGTDGNYVNDYKEQDKILYNVIIPLWENELYSEGWVSSKSLDDLKASVLTKYSPFKTLTVQQTQLIDEIVSNPDMNFVINGDAGTGKTVVLTHLVAKFLSEKKDKKVAVVVPPNWEKTAKDIFKVYDLNQSQWDVWTSTKLIKSGECYDLIIVDESHKLSRRGNKQHPSFNDVYKIEEHKDAESHLEIIQKLGRQIVLMYDVLQGIRPANIARQTYNDLTSDYEKKHLTTQFRIRAPKDATYTSDDYVNGIKWLLYKDTGMLEYTNFDENFNRDVFRGKSDDDYFGVVAEQPLKSLTDWVEDERHLYPGDVNRVLGGLVEEWAQKDGKDSTKFHWFEGNVKKRWNSTQENWIESTDDDAEQQIGSVFAVQGIDLNKVGVLMGDDLGVDENNHLYAIRENFHNVNGVFTNDEADLPEKQQEFTLFVLNIYYVLLTRGIDGIRIGFWNNPALKKYFYDVLINK